MQTDVQTAVDPASPTTSANNEPATLSATAPGQLRVIKRNGRKQKTTRTTGE